MTDRLVQELVNTQPPRSDPLNLIPITPRLTGTDTTDPSNNTYGDEECMFVEDFIAQYAPFGIIAGATPVPNNAATTLFLYVTGTRMICRFSLGDGVGSGVFDVITNGAMVQIANASYSGDGIVISLSGASVQLTQTSGSSKTASWKYQAI